MVRVATMLIGTVLFTVLTSHIVEGFITESMGQMLQNENQAMIDKLLRKYRINGGGKKILNLLGTSV